MASKWKKVLKLVESGPLTNVALTFIGVINRNPKLRRKHKIQISKDLQKYKIYRVYWRKRK